MVPWVRPAACQRRSGNQRLHRRLDFTGSQRKAAGYTAVVIQFGMRQNQQEALAHGLELPAGRAIQFRGPQVFKLSLSAHGLQ